MTSRLRRSAEWYAARHVHVFACRERDKRPATQHGVLDASTSLRAIERMWSATPAANVGIACGPSNLVVIDVDGPEGAAALALLESQHGMLPTTCEVTTARGRHIYYSHDHAERRIANSASKLGEGIDTRGHGGYVLAPPSVHPSGYVYRWATGRGPHEIELAPLPHWVIDLLTPERAESPAAPVEIDPARMSAYARRALEQECADVALAKPGMRNEALNRAAFSVGTLVGAGALDGRTARGCLIHAAQRAGLGLREAIATVNSGITSGMAQPRRLGERAA